MEPRPQPRPEESLSNRATRGADRPTIVAVNGGGNTPNGEANGVPREEPRGHAPPSHN